MAEDGGRGMPMMRVEAAPRYFNREEALGRDAASVFPTEGAGAAVDAGKALKEALGGPAFVSEDALKELKSQGRAPHAPTEPSKPLATVLAENREKKDDEFQEKWKLMKQGKNKPLDEDEVEWLNSLDDIKKQAERRVRSEEEEGLLAFQLAQAQAASAGAGPAGPAGPTAPGAKRPAAAAPPKKRKKAAFCVVVKKQGPPQPAAPPEAEAAPAGGGKEAGGGGLLGLAYSDSSDSEG